MRMVIKFGSISVRESYRRGGMNEVPSRTSVSTEKDNPYAVH